MLHVSPWITLQCRQRHYVMWSEGGSKSVKHGEAVWVSTRSGKFSHFATLSHVGTRWVTSGCCRYVLWAPPESRLSRCGCREIWFEKSWNVDLTYDCCRILQNWPGNFCTGIGDEVCFDLWVCTLVMPCKSWEPNEYILHSYDGYDMVWYFVILCDHIDHMSTLLRSSESNKWSLAFAPRYTREVLMQRCKARSSQNDRRFETGSLRDGLVLLTGYIDLYVVNWFVHTSDVDVSVYDN